MVVRSARDADLQKADWREVAHVVAAGPRARAVVVDSYLGAPMLRYIPDSRTLQPHKTAKVDAIDLVYRIPAPGHRCGRWSGLGCEVFMFPRLPTSLSRRFALVDRVERAGFIVNRYRSARAVPISQAELVPDARTLRGFVLLPDHRLRTYHLSSKGAR